MMADAHQFDQVALPESLSKNAEFFDVEGVPVSFGDTLSGRIPVCAAWDSDPPRIFPLGSMQHNGTRVTQEKFIQLVKPARAEFAA